MDATYRFNKTRIAPTPSGYLHLGNAMSFLLTQRLAKQTGAKILLRIDDLDRDRLQEKFVQDIFDTLHFLEIEWDEGPGNMEEYRDVFSQVHRLPLYNQYLEQLRQSGQLFACTCSRAEVLQQNAQGIYPGTCRDKQISLDTPGVNWRLRTDPMKILNMKEWDTGITPCAIAPSMKDFVVRKKDGYPAYQLTSFADDLHYHVDLIVRGDDLMDSSLAQLYIADVLGATSFQSICFFHHGLLLEKPGVKLSKSEGAMSIQSLRRQGNTQKDICDRLGFADL